MLDPTKNISLESDRFMLSGSSVAAVTRSDSNQIQGTSPRSFFSAFAIYISRFASTPQFTGNNFVRAHIEKELFIVMCPRAKIPSKSLDPVG